MLAEELIRAGGLDDALSALQEQITRPPSVRAVHIDEPARHD